LILAALPRDEYQRILPCLQAVPLRPGETLYEPDEPIEFGYFPTSGMISLVAIMGDGATVEVGVAGREGFVGTPILLGVSATEFRTVVQLGGGAFKIESNALQTLLPRMPRLERILHRYIQMHLAQVAQSAACNRLHELQARLSRWLLMSRDRSESNLVPLTQDLLAQMLGCRRSSVTEAAGGLHQAGLIDYRRGRLRIVNRKGLEARACECYETMKRYANAVFG